MNFFCERFYLVVRNSVSFCRKYDIEGMKVFFEYSSALKISQNLQLRVDLFQGFFLQTEDST